MISSPSPSPSRLPGVPGLSLSEVALFCHKVEHDIRVLGRRGIRCLAICRTVPVPIAVSSQSEVKEGEKEEAGDEADVDDDDDDDISIMKNITSTSPRKEKEKEKEKDKWVFLGLLTFLDPPRNDTLETIKKAKSLGIDVKMITGDHSLIAKEMARQLNMTTKIFHRNLLPSAIGKHKGKPFDLVKNYGDMILAADGFAEVYPEHKYLVIECLREMGYKVGMTGDGVNDAPALKAADVGIAVEGSTDAAKAAADLVLTQPGLSTIIHGIVIARCTFARIRSFLT